MKRYHRLIIIYALFFIAGALAAAGAVLFKRHFDLPLFTKDARPSVDTSRYKAASWEEARLQSPILMSARKEGSEIIIPAGIYAVEKSIIIPAGYALHIEPDTRFNLAPRVSIVSYSEIIAEGEESRPIIFTTADDRTPFGVLAVLDAPGMSVLRHVRIRNGYEADIDGKRVTGSAAFIGSDVLVEYSAISDTKGEDGLNVRHASSTIAQTEFENNEGDALDIDSSEARVLLTSFKKTGRDSIDIASSTAELRGNQFKGAARCIEVGEKSIVSLYANQFERCDVKFSVDDDTRVFIDQGTL